MDWFETLTGFRETGYEATRARLEVRDGRLHSRVNGASHGVGTFELASLQALRARARSAGARSGRRKLGVMSGDVRALHREPAHAGALFQVASQFNMLEMTGPSVTPEDGVTRYAADRTQGPACAIAAGGATILRNYFVPVGGGVGQTATRQLDGLAAVGEALKVPVAELWQMQNDGSRRFPGLGLRQPVQPHTVKLIFGSNVLDDAGKTHSQRVQTVMRTWRSALHAPCHPEPKARDLSS